MDAARLPARPSPRRMAGLTLLEILVAMAIGLIGIVVITQTYLVNENYKRSTVSAGGAQSNGALALYSLERDVRMGGWGIAWASALACAGMRWHYSGAYSNPPGGALPLIAVAPVVITDGGAGPDTITVMYGSATERVIPASLSANMANSDADMQVDNPQGFNQTPGDLVLVAQGNTCAMMQLTAVGVSTGILGHAPGPTAPYNPNPASLLPVFTTGALLFNLGRPAVNAYSIDTTRYTLQLASLFSSTSSTVVPAYTPTPFTVVEGIVDLQAEYGKDNGIDNSTVSSTIFTANDGRVDGYDNVSPAAGDSTAWGQILSIRLGVLARSEFYEKPPTPGDPTSCTTTAAAPTWRGGTFTVPGADWRCYSYRVFETVVPLRNMIWRQG
jgi:type IV pilus assembly protein PilW